MTDKQIKVGDVVAWDKVPSEALVAATELEFSDMHALRRSEYCCWVTVEK